MKGKAWLQCHPLLTPRRLKAEAMVMAKAYPQMTLDFNGRRLSFRGALISNYGSVFRIAIALGRRYPEAEPWLWVEEPTLDPRTPHRYINGRVCAHAQPFIPYRTTCAAMVSVMAGWIFRFERNRLEGVNWDVPIEGGQGRLKVSRDGQLYLSARG